MPRIASLLPSTTEIVCALGQREQLVGRSHECDFPAEVTSLPVLTEARLDPSRASLALDGDVRRLIEQGLSIYEVDAERLRALEPDVILTQDQCAVCAASLADVERALAQWLGHAPAVVSVSPNTLGDVWTSMQALADALGVPERGRRLTAGDDEGTASMPPEFVGDRTHQLFVSGRHGPGDPGHTEPLGHGDENLPDLRGRRGDPVVGDRAGRRRRALEAVEPARLVPVGANPSMIGEVARVADVPGSVGEEVRVESEDDIRFREVVVEGDRLAKRRLGAGPRAVVPDRLVLMPAGLRHRVEHRFAEMGQSW